MSDLYAGRYEAFAGSGQLVDDRTQKQRYDAAVQRLAERGITTVLLRGDEDYVREQNVERFEFFARVARTPGRWAGAAMPAASWTTTSGILRFYSRTNRQWHPVNVLHFSYPYWTPAIAEAIAEEFQRQSFRVDWSGDPGDAVAVHLV